MIKVECFPVGALEANCYAVFDTTQKLCFVVDTGGHSSQLERSIDLFGSSSLKYILLTHGHFDHIGNTAAIKRKYPEAKIVIGAGDSPFTTDDSLNLTAYFGSMSFEHFKADAEVSDGDELSFGDKKIKVIATPGHTKGGVCYLFEHILFTGDTIMSRTTGRMDFPTGSSKDMINSAHKIAGLEGNLKLYCGHGSSTTLDYERENNIAMRNYINEDIY